MSKENESLIARWLNERYYISEIIGEGGFGIVYKAFDILLNSYVAIKEFKTDSRTVYEARIMKTLRNVPYISRYRDSFEIEEYTYIVMNLLKGQSLQNVLIAGRKLSSDELLDPLENLLVGIGHMHKMGYIHRDISPGNLFYTDDGDLILIDFGSATAIDKNSENYNPVRYEHKGFQSPENGNPEEVGPWTDIFSFCATFFYLMTGEAVLDSDSRKRIDNVPMALLKSTLSARQQNAIISGLYIDYEKRCQSAETLRTLLFGQEKNNYIPKAVLYGAGTNVGAKAINQDNLLVDNLFYYEGRDFQKQGIIECKCGELHLVSVCDGVGGANSGELASLAVVQALKHFIEQHRNDTKLPERLIEELLNQINEKIISLGKKIGKTATTVSFLLWKDNQYFVVNVGDSPVFLLRGRNLTKLSTEHTRAYAKEAEGIVPERKDKNTLVNYIGKSNVAGSQIMSIRHGYINKNDIFIVCTDGVTNKVKLNKLKRLLYKKGTDAISYIFKLLSKEGNCDNYSSVIVKF